MVQSEFSAALNQVCSEKGLSVDAVLATIEQALVSAYRKDYGGNVEEISAKVDKETGEQLAVKNVVVQISKLTGPVDEHAHILYQTIGNGKAIIFQDGKVMEGLWRKSSRTARTMFYDADGNPVEFSRGKIWIEIVPSIKDVSY
ncbi:MAG: PT repeat-containing protein [Candidatus Gottesmanbacteria bacterium GW2011_GWC2_39_8]|uniref:PT repeat-containing protein n=1 Tax=Candidatus Gottesmanbacteria bacterium GW2011_GWC2_39_8 TaxID=1618450 RepID=A0A0G0SZ33_9BACT|nr:MAG: PT repeat-containing protein [Candidatus Gottesmanbacteria bacterium GW2011_GWC2_39_8]